MGNKGGRKCGMMLLLAVLFVSMIFMGCVSATTPPEEGWSQTFGGTSSEEASSVQQTTDGGYILAGTAHGDFWLVKTDSDGNKVWDKTFGGTDRDAAHSIQQTTDGGYIIAGGTTASGSDLWSYVWLIKTDSDGNKVWDKTFQRIDSGMDMAYSVQQTTDGGYIIVGATMVYGAGYNFDVWLVKTDSDGNKVWDKRFGGSDWDGAGSVQQTADGGYIFAGATRSYGAGDSDAWLVKTDLDGKEVWNMTFGGTDCDEAHSVQQTTDGGYIVGGETKSYGAGEYDFWLIKVAAEESTSKKGDLNGDDEITSADAAIALSMAVCGKYDPATDVSSDGRVTSLDTLMILQAAVGAISL